MRTPDEHPDRENEPVPPECRATVELLQRALDGEATPEALDADPHPLVCAACCERVRAARVLLAALAAPRGPVAVPADFARRVTERMWAERHARTRRRSYVGACAAIAAGLLLVAALGALFSAKPERAAPHPLQLPPEFAKPPAPEVAPLPHAPRPVRLADELAKAEHSLREVPQPLAESAAAAPKLVGAIGNVLTLPDAPPDPMAAALEPARQSLASLPAAAQAGLEPVTDTAEKALKRFLSDVRAVKPRS